ncbi:MAG: ribose-phosphate diphosphokinase [Mobiluncus porci]|uniref:ribose-phosphate diphosphokinase n=1 Tax=Mobiluncus porci TaxID=2652278 RepID=A0A7K0K4M4_9ACTO|nr:MULTISPECIES: ribose-phosphate diphosphokinase [Mobiluncus]MCI6584775.1 ribose-phosphate diphosphokinase [Mobiluncus sp.]MDD7542218.1 ribose-phosphate diphosphokinase [Mobiluncus porci]MDY5747971.1 ribose-phosphate diphosphokinase [Mobiluncus porci]MST50399.1 ribose-phosphate diphosphokinase [Mobiluncus porci]
MADLFETPRKRLVIVSGRAHPQLAEDVAKALDTEVLPTSIYDFASGEIYVRYNESVRGCDVFCIQSIAGDVNKWLMEQFIMVDALKRASAKRITVVAPLYPYSRQDKKHQGREPISARLMADLYKTAGTSRMMSVDMHASQESGFFPGPVDHLQAMPVLIDYVRTRVDLSNVTVVSPDAGRIRVAEKWANRLGGYPLAFIHKTRDTTRPNVAVANRVVGNVEGRTCVLVDDLIDTGGTIAEAVGVLKTAGAKDVLVAATHAVFSDPAVKRLSECGAREVIVTDSVLVPPEKQFPQLTVLPIAPLLARAIRQVFEEGSVAALFE